MPELRVWEGRVQRGAIGGALISTEDWRLEHFLLPPQRRAQDRTPYLVLKDSLGSSQARGLKSAVGEGQRYEVRDGTENRVVDFGEEEYRATGVR